MDQETLDKIKEYILQSAVDMVYFQDCVDLVRMEEYPTQANPCLVVSDFEEFLETLVNQSNNKSNLK